MRAGKARELTGGSWVSAEADPERDGAMLAGAEALAARIRCFALAYLDVGGHPLAKGISLKKNAGLGRLWFATHRSSAHAAALLGDPRASAFFQDLASYEGMNLRGRCVEELDRAAKEACWVEWYKDSFPGGPSDPAYLVFRFEAESGNYSLGGRSLDFIP